MNGLRVGGRIVIGAALVAAIPVSGATGRSSDIAVKDRANANASIAARGQFVAIVWSASVLPRLLLRRRLARGAACLPTPRQLGIYRPGTIHVVVANLRRSISG